MQTQGLELGPTEKSSCIYWLSTGGQVTLVVPFRSMWIITPWSGYHHPHFTNLENKSIKAIKHLSRSPTISKLILELRSVWFQSSFHTAWNIHAAEESVSFFPHGLFLKFVALLSIQGFLKCDDVIILLVVTPQPSFQRELMCEVEGIMGVEPSMRVILSHVGWVMSELLSTVFRSRFPTPGQRL